MARSTARSSDTGKASPTKKSTKKSASGTTRNAPQKKGAQKKAPQKDGGQEQASSNGAPRAESRPSPRAGQVAARAAEELLELTGKGAEGITGLERTEDGWTIQVEVVEVRRIPDTTDVLALYEVQTDRHGSLQGYRRIRRYARGVPGED